MAKTNSLRLSMLVAATAVATLILIATDQVRAVTTTTSPAVDAWSKVEKVTGSLSFAWNIDQAGPNGGFHRRNDTVTLPAVTLEKAAEGRWAGSVTAEIDVEREAKVVDSSGKVVAHHRRYGTRTMALSTEMIVSSLEGAWTSIPDGQQYSGDHFLVGSQDPGLTTVTHEDLLTGQTSEMQIYVAVGTTVMQPLPAQGLNLSGRASSPSDPNGVGTRSWSLTGAPAQQQLRVSSDRERACPNQNVAFTARNRSGNLVNARWSGGGVPDTGRGSRFTTRFRNHGQRTVTARTASGASASKTIEVLQNSGLAWVPRFPTSTDTADLEMPFRDNVEQFIAALQAAGATVNISATRRPAERAWLMHYSWRIANRGFDPADVPRREGIDICWLHRNRDGVVDRQASIAAARQMAGPNGYAISRRLRFPPDPNSNHIRGEAIDMDITWTGTLNIATPDGTIVPITTTPRTGADNVQLWDFAEAHYDVLKLRQGDPPHWSDDGH